jgi:protein phosphatase 1G
MQGWRRTMEDAHIAYTNLPNGLSLFGVFDGHGGKNFSFKVINTLGQEVALYVKKYYLKVLTNSSHFKARNYKQALEESFINLD